MRVLTLWKAEVVGKDGSKRQAWYGRTREGTQHRYFGPSDSRLVLVHAAYRQYGKEPMKTTYTPAWDDIGPPGWDPSKAYSTVSA